MMIKSEIKWYSVDEKLPSCYMGNFPYVIACVEEDVQTNCSINKTRVTKIIKYKWLNGKTNAFRWFDFYGGTIEKQSTVKYWAYVPEFECDKIDAKIVTD